MVYEKLELVLFIAHECLASTALELATLVPLQLLKSSGTKCIMIGRQKEKTLKKMGFRVPALPFTFVAHLPAVAAIVMVLLWNIHFRGGLAWEATNKNLIFNVCFLFHLAL
ncbi:hypothetical protein HN873_018824 [Arachis hypogaea]